MHSHQGDVDAPCPAADVQNGLSFQIMRTDNSGDLIGTTGRQKALTPVLSDE
jgi:hypothetical protein